MVEQKQAQVILISDLSNAKGLTDIKEKFVSRQISINADIPSVAEYFVEESAGSQFIEQEHKDAIVKMFQRSKCENLRTVGRVVNGIGELSVALDKSLPIEAVNLVTSLNIENTTGSLQDQSFYEFNPLEFLFQNTMHKTQQSRSEQTVEEPISDELTFHSKYYSENMRYSYFGSIYGVAYGTLSKDRLNSDIFPLKRD